MKLQEQTLATAPAAFSWFGAEFLSILQLLFFLTLGYAVTKTWMWSRARTLKKFVKKIDDVDQIIEEIQGIESDASPVSKKASAGAHERKKKKKATKEADASPTTVEKLQYELDPVESAEPTPVQVSLKARPQEQLPEEQLPEAPAQENEVHEPQEVPPPVHEETVPLVVTERVAKMLAKKMERKAKKAQEKNSPQPESTSQEKVIEEEKSHPVEGGHADKSDIVPTLEAKSDAEALSDDMAQTTSTKLIDSVPNEAEPEDPIDSDSAADPFVQEVTHEGICTPEEFPSPRGTGNESPVWCAMPQVPCPEGWMAVAVPAEFAPPGAPGPFDGLWQNGEEERIVIDHEEIHFESGMKWVMQMHSLTSLSVQVGEEEFTADLNIADQQLVWSDGDVWKCMGQTEGQQRWAEAREADGLSCILFEGEQMMQMNSAAMVPPMPFPMLQTQMIPEDAKDWEICYDWSKKGWCSRPNCEWYHPVQAQNNGPCGPCGSAPFSDFMDMTYAQGPIY